MRDFISTRANSLPKGGGLYEVFQMALDLEQTGKEIIHMEIGRPDFDSPPNAKQAAIDSLQQGFVHYTALSGTRELREAIAQKLQKERGLKIDVEKGIFISAGACEALLSIMLSTLNDGDEIIIPSPYFTGYTDEALLAGAKLVEIPLKLENHFQLDLADVEKAITSKTKAILINSPHNPTGVIFNRETLRGIGNLAQKYDLLLLSDECYDAFVFEGEHVSLYDFEDLRDRTILINSASKIFSMTGWRVGYAVGPEAVIQNANNIHKNMSTCATSFAQMGAAEAFLHSGEYTKNMVSEFKKRRDLLTGLLDEIEGFQYVRPQGAFYVMVCIDAFRMSAKEFCGYILEEAGVVIVPGEAFGAAGKGFVRLAYACSSDDITTAMKKIKEAVKKISA